MAIDNSEPFPVTDLPVYLINSEQICDDQKVPKCQIWLYYIFCLLSFFMNQSLTKNYQTILLEIYLLRSTVTFKIAYQIVEWIITLK